MDQPIDPADVHKLVSEVKEMLNYGVFIAHVLCVLVVLQIIVKTIVLGPLIRRGIKAEWRAADLEARHGVITDEQKMRTEKLLVEATEVLRTIRSHSEIVASATERGVEQVVARVPPATADAVAEKLAGQSSHNLPKIP